MDSRFYFNQYWACTNVEILTHDDLREILFNIWDEMFKEYSKNAWCNELWLSDLGKAYKQRVLKGK